MAELVTGVEFSEDQVAAVLEAEFFLAPSLRYPGSEAAPTEPTLVIPEAEAGLAAAGRIGRDVEGAIQVRACCRARSDRWTVERQLPRHAPQVCSGCARIWTRGAMCGRRVQIRIRRCRGCSPAPGLNYELDKEMWAYSVDHPDQLTGRNGAVRTSFVQVEKPARAVLRWNWMQPTGKNGNATWDHPGAGG